MSKICIELTHQFKEETVMLLAMDKVGLDAFRLALAKIDRHQTSELRHAGTICEFEVMDSGDEIDLQTGHVYWRFTRSKLLKVLEKMDSLNEAPGPGHHYVDISGPVKTLVLSRDEYV